MFILWRHILRVHLGPFVFSVFVLMFIFLLQFLMKFLDQLAGKGLSASVIVELIVLNLAWMLVLAVPMGVLVATLMAFGGLAATNQITAMRAGGMSLYRMMAPVLAASVVVCLLLIKFNNDVLPDANHKTKVLTSDISRKKPTLTLVPGLFSQLMQGYSILVRKTFEHSNDLEGVTIYDHSRPFFFSTVTGARGTISFSPDYRKLIMDLYDGEIHEVGTTDYKEYRFIRFQKHRIAMDAEGFNFQRSQESTFSRGDRELSVPAMQVIVDSLRRLEQGCYRRIEALTRKSSGQLFAGHSGTPVPAAPTDPSQAAQNEVSVLRSSVENELSVARFYDLEADRYLVEIHKKYAIPVACIVFVLVGAPLGIMARRGTFGVGASLSLGFFLLYWACLIGGEKLADRAFVEPWFGMWIANILIGTLGAYLTYRTARETLSIDWTRLSRFVPKSWRPAPSTIEEP